MSNMTRRRSTFESSKTLKSLKHRRNDLIQFAALPDFQRNPENDNVLVQRIYYHAYCVEILAMCCGSHKKNASLCQKIFSFEVGQQKVLA